MIITSKKPLIITAVIAIFVFCGLFYVLIKNDSKMAVKKNIAIAGEIYINWQKISITEEAKNIFIDMTVPRVMTMNSYEAEAEINKAIKWRIESLKDDFISAVEMVAEDNGETSKLNIDTEILLITPRLISLAFTAKEQFAGSQYKYLEQTFLVFDLTKKDKIWIEDHELFRDDSAWASAAEIIKTSLLSGYQGEPSCDLLFAPKHNGLAASCIGIDRSRGGEHFSINGEIPLSLVKNFLAPQILADIIQP